MRISRRPLSVTGFARDTSPRKRGEVKTKAPVRLTSPHLWGEVARRSRDGERPAQ